jgi:transcriptional regulator with XRE-family HTH domain
MSRFSQALRQVIDEACISQVRLAELTQLDSVMINRYARGRSAIGWDSLEKLLAAFSPQQQATLVCAYLRDCFSDRYHGLVEITPLVAGPVSEPALPPVEFDGLPADFLAALRFIASKAHEDVVRDLVEDLARLLRGQVNLNTRSPVSSADSLRGISEH